MSNGRVLRGVPDWCWRDRAISGTKARRSAFEHAPQSTISVSPDSNVVIEINDQRRCWLAPRRL
jgi:hypothetical protein